MLLYWLIFALGPNFATFENNLFMWAAAKSPNMKS